MATISRTDSLNNQTSLSKPLQKTTPKATDSLYSYALENKSTIAKIALGMFGAITVGAATYYNYDRLSSLDIWSIKDTEPFPKPDVKLDQPDIEIKQPDIKIHKPDIRIQELNTEINKPVFDPILTNIQPIHGKVSFNNTSPIFFESLFQAEEKQENPGCSYTHITGTPFVSQEVPVQVEDKTVETEQPVTEKQIPKQDEPSEPIKQEEETVFAVPVYNDEESGTADSFYDKHYHSIAGLGLLTWAGAVSFLYWKIFKALEIEKNENALLESLSSKAGIGLSPKGLNPAVVPSNETVAAQEGDKESEENHGEKKAKVSDAIHANNDIIPKGGTSDTSTLDSNSIQAKIMVSTPAKNGSFKDEDLDAAVINVFKTILDNGNVIYTPQFDPKLMIERIKDLSDGALKLLQTEKNAQNDAIAAQLQDDAKDLQLSLAALSPVKLSALEPDKEIDSKEFTSNDGNVPMKRGASSTRGRGGARGGRGGSGTGVAKRVILTDEEKHYANEAKKIQRNWISRANSYSEFTGFTFEAKAQIEHLKVLLGIHEFYKEENSKLGFESPQYILADENYKKAHEELESFKRRSMSPITPKEGGEKFKKFTSLELEILLVINKIHGEGKKVDLENDRPDFTHHYETDTDEVKRGKLVTANDKWKGFIALQDEWAATLQASRGFAAEIQNRIDNRKLEAKNSKFEPEPSEEISKYVPQKDKPKASSVKLFSKPSVMTPVDEIKLRHQARLNRAGMGTDSSDLGLLDSPYRPPVDKPKYKPSVNVDKEIPFVQATLNAALRESISQNAEEVVQTIMDKLQQELVDASKDAELNSSIIIELKETLKFLGEYLYKQSAEHHVLQAVRKCLISHAESELQLSDAEAIVYADDLIKSKNPDVVKGVSENETVDLDDLIKGLKDSQSDDEKEEVGKNSNANLYEENKTLINRFERQYFESLRDTLDKGVTELTDDLLGQEGEDGDDFVATLEQAQKPLDWVKAYLVDNQTTDPDVVAFIKTHREAADELIRMSLIQDAVKSGKTVDEATKFANDVMGSKPLSYEELFEQHDIPNAITKL